MTVAAPPVRPMTDLERPSRASLPTDRLRAGDPMALTEFVRRHEPEVRRLAYRITGWRGEIDDLVQDIFASALVALPGFRGESEIETWLTRIAINRCRRHLRRQRVRDLWRHVVRRERGSDSPRRESAIDRNETNSLVRRAVADLPPKYREVVVLRYMETRSTQEISEILGLRANTIDVRLHRARALLQAALQPLMET